MRQRKKLCSSVGGDLGQLLPKGTRVPIQLLEMELKLHKATIKVLNPTITSITSS